MSLRAAGRVRCRGAAKASARAIAIAGGSLLLVAALNGCAYLPWVHRRGTAAATARSKTNDSLQVVAAESSGQPPRSAPFAIAAGPGPAIWFGEFLSNDIGRISPLGQGAGESEFGLSLADSATHRSRVQSQGAGESASRGQIQVKLFRVKDGGIAERMAGGPDNAIWFTDPSSNRIGRINGDGDVAFVRLLVDHAGPAGITLGPDGNLWFSEHRAERIGRVTPLGIVTEFALPHGGDPAGIATGADGRIYFAENSGNRIGRIGLDGVIDEFPLPNPGSAPNSIVGGPDGNLWFTELGSQKIGRLTPQGDMTEFALPVAALPMDLAAGTDAAVWVTLPGVHAVARIAPDGRANVFYFAETVIPSLITTGSDGNVWFTEPTGKIGRLSVAGVLTEFPATPSELRGN